MDGGVPNYYQSWTNYKTLSQFVYLLSRLQPTKTKRKERQGKKKKTGQLRCVKGGGGEGGKKEKKEAGKKGEGIGERKKGTPAIINPFCSRPQILIG